MLSYLESQAQATQMENRMEINLLSHLESYSIRESDSKMDSGQGLNWRACYSGGSTTERKCHLGGLEMPTLASGNAESWRVEMMEMPGFGVHLHFAISIDR